MEFDTGIEKIEIRELTLEEVIQYADEEEKLFSKDSVTVLEKLSLIAKYLSKLTNDKLNFEIMKKMPISKVKEITKIFENSISLKDSDVQKK